jgi:hypothetical protein
MRRTYWLALAATVSLALAGGFALAGSAPESATLKTPVNVYGSQGRVFAQDDAGALVISNPGSGSATATASTAAHSGATTLTAGAVDGGTASATQIPQADVGYATRSGLTLQNLDGSPIWCGFTSGVNSTNGTQVDGSPDGIHAGGSFAAPVGSAQPVYCWSAAGQISPANVRWVEVQ